MDIYKKGLSFSRFVEIAILGAVLLAFPFGFASAAVNITGATFNGAASAEVGPGDPVTVAVTYTSTASNDVESASTNGVCEDTLNSSTSGTFTRSYIYAAPLVEGWSDALIKLFGSDATVLFGLIQVDNNWCLGADRAEHLFPNAIHVTLPVAPVVPPTPEEACVASNGTWVGETSECVPPPFPSSGGGAGISFLPYCDEPLYGKEAKWPNCMDRVNQVVAIAHLPFPVFTSWWDEVTKSMQTSVEY